MRTRRFTHAAEAPIVEINTTPMIDVLLVLMIMLMLSLPVPTHKIAVDIGSGGRPIANPPPVVELAIAANGGLIWNGVPLPVARLDDRLAALVADPAKPLLQLSADPAVAYERFDTTLATIKRAGVTKIAFADNPQTF
jgi:biopolymer transport protein ExbD